MTPKAAINRLSLGDVVALAWLVVAFALLFLPVVINANPTPDLRIMFVGVILVGLLAAPIAVVRSLVLTLRWLSQPHGEDAADYGDERAEELGGTADPPGGD
jgi:hypothetical protein